MAIEQPPKNPEERDYDRSAALWSLPELQDVLARITDDYLYWDKVKHLAPKDICAEHLWQAVKIHREIGLQRVRFGKYTFSFNVTSAMQSLLHNFDLNMGGSLSADGIIPNNDKQMYLISSIMEEAIASSQMEGASTTRKVAKDMLRKKLNPTNKSQQMILNNYRTIQQLNEQKDKELTMDMLLDVHQNISEHTLDNPADEGRLRNTDDIYVMDAINGEIAWIHPFVDGNGRTARSLVYWYLLKKGYWLTEYLSISRIIYKNKKRYERIFLYTEADDKDMTYFILYNLQVMKKAYEELKLYLARKQEERKSILMYSDIDGINERQTRILRILDEVCADEAGGHPLHRPLHGQRAYPRVHVRCAAANLSGLRLFHPRGRAEHPAKQPLRAGHRRPRGAARLFRRDDEGAAGGQALLLPRV